MLVFESIRNRRAECHIASHVIPADDTHALPLFKEFLQSPQLQGGLRLDLAHWRVWCVGLTVLDASCPGSTVASELSLEAVTSSGRAI